MATPKKFLKMLTSSDEEITKIISRMSEKNAKETLNFAIRCLRDIDKIERIYFSSNYITRETNDK